MRCRIGCGVYFDNADAGSGVNEVDATQPVFTGNTGAEARFKQRDLRVISFTVGCAQRRHQKFIPAQTTDNIVLLFLFGQTLAHFYQELVASLVAVTIVNQLEIIQIDERDDGVTLKVPRRGKQRGQIFKMARRLGKPVRASV